jgi:hypothetical protein
VASLFYGRLKKLGSRRQSNWFFKLWWHGSYLQSPSPFQYFACRFADSILVDFHIGMTLRIIATSSKHDRIEMKFERVCHRGQQLSEKFIPFFL